MESYIKKLFIKNLKLQLKLISASKSLDNISNVVSYDSEEFTEVDSDDMDEFVEFVNAFPDLMENPICMDFLREICYYDLSILDKIPNIDIYSLVSNIYNGRKSGYIFNHIIDNPLHFSLNTNLTSEMYEKLYSKNKNKNKDVLNNLKSNPGFVKYVEANSKLNSNLYKDMRSFIND